MMKREGTEKWKCIYEIHVFFDQPLDYGQEKKNLFMQVINKAMHFFYLLTHTGESRICKGWKLTIKE